MDLTKFSSAKHDLQLRYQFLFSIPHVSDNCLKLYHYCLHNCLIYSPKLKNLHYVLESTFLNWLHDKHLFFLQISVQLVKNMVRIKYRGIRLLFFDN
jgi:hypothetical protein